MAKKLESITINGNLVGNLWGGGKGMLEVKQVFTQDDRPFTRQWTGIRDALLHLTNDGNFVSCRLALGSMKITWINGKKTETMHVDIPTGKETNDLIVSDEEYYDNFEFPFGEFQDGSQWNDASYYD